MRRLPRLTGIRRLGMGSGGGAAVAYLLRDLFITDAAAPLTSPRTCEPGPGTLIITDTGNRASIVNQKLHLTRSAGATWGNPAVWGPARTRATGLALLVEGKINARAMIGWDTDQAGTIEENSYHLDSGVIQVRMNGVSVATGDTYLVASTDRYAVILRTAGALFIFNDQLEWVDGVCATATVYPALSLGDNGTALDFDYLTDRQLPAPFDDDYGIATERLAGARAAGNTFTHEANNLIGFTAVTRPSSGAVDFRFREQDADNYWKIEWESTGVCRLYEVVGGVATQRGGDPVDNLAAGQQVVIICDNENIRVNYTNKLEINYATAANFKTATAGRLAGLGTGGAISDIVTWPRTISVEAKAVIDSNFT